MKKLLLVGATGLVGQSVLQMALTDKRVATVIAPTRRGLPVAPRLVNPLVDFERLQEDADWWKADAVICCLGTTIRVAGSQEAFYKVDHDYPLQVAKLALRQGASAYALNSALGADANSRVFYSRTKGELERDLTALGYSSLTFVRPGLIGGERKELRPAEAMAVKASGWAQALLPKRYRVVPATQIARCLLEAALSARPGMQVIMSEAI